MKSTVAAFVFGHTATEKFWKHRNKLASKNVIARAYHMICYQRMLSKNQAWISSEAFISAPFNLPHGLSGIFVSSGAAIGEGCTVFHQVTIGSNTLKDSEMSGAPILGNNVYIGVGAKIIGNVKIGNNVRIGANCVVVQDIPDNSTVVMNKPRIIGHKEARDNAFVHYNLSKE